MTKPFSPRELVARIKSVLRRSPNRLLSGEYTGRQDGVQPARSLYGDGVLRAGRIEVRVGPHEVTLEGEPVRLTIREFELLAFLMSNPRRVFTREELLERVWGYAFGDQSTVTVHVRRLREKIEVTPAAPRHVVTVWGVGYRFDP
jgi:DNA-binding response OmpR family regulator